MRTSHDLLLLESYWLPRFDATALESTHVNSSPTAQVAIEKCSSASCIRHHMRDGFDLPRRRSGSDE